MQQSVIISGQFNGPPKSANGGYASGLLAASMYAAGYHGAVEASLHAPPPLDHALQLSANNEGALLMNGEAKMGSAKSTKLALEVPHLPTNPVFCGDPPIDNDALAPFDICFVCGRARPAGDGLCLFSQCIEGHDNLVGAPWHLHKNFATDEGLIDPLYVWSALDCPGYYACAFGEPALLGRLTAELIKPLKAESDAMVFGWSLNAPNAQKSRKRRCGTAIVDSDGDLVAKAEGLWITINSDKIAS